MEAGGLQAFRISKLHYERFWISIYFVFSVDFQRFSEFPEISMDFCGILSYSMAFVFLNFT